MRSYAIGFIAALSLTLTSFAIPVFGEPTGRIGLVLLGALAMLQIAVHFRFFLHIDLKSSHRDDLLLILFTTLIVAFMVSGSIWILWSQHLRM